MSLQRPRGPRRVSGALFVVLLSVLSPLAVTASAQLRPTIAQEVPATATDLRAPASYNSPMVLADPTEPRFVALAHRQDAPEFGCGLQVSGDGGRSWIPTNPVPTLPEGAERCYAPEIVFDRKGRLYYLFIALAGLGNNPTGVYLVTSDDHGRTFSAPRSILGPSNYQVRMAIDRDIGTRGRLHLVWLHAATDAALGGLTADANPLFSAYSDDGGDSFSKPVQVSDPDRQRVVGPAIAVGPDHAVHIAYYDLQDDVRDYQGLEGPVWDGDWSVVVTSSTDRGRSFGKGVLVDDEIRAPGRVMLIYTMPPPALAVDGDGRVLVAWTDARHGDPDVILSRSADRGRTFSEPLRVNDDAVGNGRDQYLPRLGVAPSGRADVVFFDRRDDPANIRNDVFYASSEDGGQRFGPNVKVTTSSSDTRIGARYRLPAAEGLFEIGGRLGLLSRGSSAVVAWPDMRNAAVGTAQQDLFTTVLEFPGGSDDAGRSTSGGGGVPVAVIVGGAAAVVAAAATVLVVRRRTLSRTKVVD